MKTRRSLVVVAAAGLLALSGTAAAVAGDSPTPSSPDTRGASPRQGPKCDRVEHVITNLELVQARVEARIARVEERIASGDLSEKRLANAKRFLAKLQHRLVKLETLIERLETKFEQKCSSGDPA
jgi:hypothetical protein